LPNCPSQWTFDPLKIAVLLRTADAAHLDARRAPGLLRAFRRPESISREHWIFQEHLLKPRVEVDRLVYTTAHPFPPEEAAAWWLCEENLRMVDSELHQVDALLADLRHPRFRVKGVAGIESLDRLKAYVEVSGWLPVDARLHVSNVAELVRRLGGEQLYGDKSYIPLRELIQNASDAIRARQVLENHSSDWGGMTVRLGRDEQGPWIEVEDIGVGMSEAVLAGPLLDFGMTYWGSALMREEHEGLWARGFEPTGRFGVGFFSVFMWGDRVRITTRQFESAKRDTLVLELAGLAAKPLMRSAKSDEQLREGGTMVRVWLTKEPRGQGGVLRPLWFEQAQQPIELDMLCAWLAPALAVNLYVEDENERRLAVAASDWLTMDGAKLLARLTMRSIDQKMQVQGNLMRVIEAEGEVLGRAALFGVLGALVYNEYRTAGVVTVGGLRSTVIHGGILGVLVGSPQRAARDQARPLADAHALEGWASSQATIIAQNIGDPDLQMACASLVIYFGGDPGDLYFARGENVFFNKKSVGRWAVALNEVAFYSTEYMSVSAQTALHAHVLCSYTPSIYRTGSRFVATLEVLMRTVLAKAWGCSPAEVVLDTPEKYEIGFFKLFKVPEEQPIVERGVKVFRKPSRASTNAQ
jgi:hypothetical protein